MILPGPLDGPDRQDGQPAGKVATDYSLTSLAAIKKFLSETIGYDLKIPDNATGVYGKHVFRNGNLVSEPVSPAGRQAGKVAIEKASRDQYGYIRVSGPATSQDGQEQLFEAVLIESRVACPNGQAGQISWRVIQARAGKLQTE